MEDARCAKDLASQAYDNLDLAHTQVRRMVKGKSPNSDRRYIELEDGYSSSPDRQASTLAYKMADISGKLADVLERAGNVKSISAITKTVELVTRDSNARIELINASFKAFAKKKSGS